MQLADTPTKASKAPPSGFTSYEKFVVAALSFLQFTVILDFMILSPLGAILMPTLKISTTQFGWVVSAYAFSAGISGILAAGFADRFDRKKILLFFYAGFILGTLLCGLATNYPFLLAARMVTGLFGGVIGSISFAIITDVFPFEKRGRVMGFVQTSFGASQILGIPLGLYLSNLWGWHAPFLMIVGASVLAGFFLVTKLRPIDAHLAKRPDRHAFHHLVATLSNARYLRAFAATALMATGGFMLMPFSSAFNVHNLGVPLEKLPMIYLITGFCAILTGPFIGRASDQFGKFRVFVFGSFLSILMVTVYTRLNTTPIVWVIVTSAIMFVGISSRMIPSQALLSAIPDMSSRGSFMSVNSSIQQISGGFASVLAGWIVAEGPGGRLMNFDMLGVVVSSATLLTLVQMYFINRQVTAATGKTTL